MAAQSPPVGFAMAGVAQSSIKDGANTRIPGWVEHAPLLLAHLTSLGLCSEPALQGGCSYDDTAPKLG